MTGRSALETSFARIDAANELDPNRADWAGDTHPKELLHAWRASHWLTQLAPESEPALRLALRAHHVERWMRPRGEYPSGRAGYLRWRKDAQRFHADRLAELVGDAAIEADVIERAQQLIRKERPDDTRRTSAQTFEDVLCLVFLEQQLA